jgi:hypothetical protein
VGAGPGGLAAGRGGDERGLERLRRAADLDLDAVPAAYEVAHSFLVGAGRFEDAEEWDGIARAYAELQAGAEAERATLTGDETVVPHGLPDATVEAVAAHVRGDKRVKRAFLAHRKLALLDDHDPQWILAVEQRSRHLRFERSNAAARPGARPGGRTRPW